MAEGVGEGVVETSTNPMQRRLSMHLSPRCGARTRIGSSCQSPAVRGKARCRMHGAYAGAPEGPRNGAWRHGGRSHEARLRRQEMRLLLRMVRQELEAEQKP